jgi:morphogenetic protein associated with SpoVID
LKIHIVQKGDTLWNIAKKYGVNFEELKSMNTQLSNPDLIMPGMKIKVPSGNVAVKKEAPMTTQAPKKEMPIAEHPFAKEKPKAVISEENYVPKEPVTEKQSKPFIPPVPNVQHPVYTGIDMNNYYTVNMEMMPKVPNPPLPPKPENILPEMKKVDELKKGPAKEQPHSFPLDQHEGVSENMENMSNVPNMSNVANMANMANMPTMPTMPMPAYTAPAMYYPQYCAPQYMVPVSPILPGSGLCPPGPFHPMPYGHGPMMPCQPFPTAVSPAEYAGDGNMPHAPNVPYPQAVAPAQFNPGFPVNPYAGVPESPILPGSGLHHPHHALGSYGEDHDDGYEYEHHAHAPNMPNQPAVAPAYYPPQNDCGCGGPAPYAYPYQDYRFNYGYPVQQPYPAQGYNPYGYHPGQVAPDGQMFGMPDYDDRDEDED